jgi:hypothetical protein
MLTVNSELGVPESTVNKLTTIISFASLAYGKMMKVAVLFYLHDVLYDMTFCSLLKGT